ncbi:enolase 4 [Denticeps clupeoides]|uniref:Enolase 4 n=1 Tax=Denticeps clupeoides TaxID=299321 RepID=A0AAY4EKW8_9TELE|nr:enolase 4 [Denticeps clupeoides]
MAHRRLGRRDCALSQEDRDFCELKQKAAEYVRASGVAQTIEGVLNELFLEQPDDVYGHLANYFSRLSAKPVVAKICGREVYDATGRLSVQAELFCHIRNEDKWTCRAAVPSDCEDPENCLPEAGDEGGRGCRRGQSVDTALCWMNEFLSPMLKGVDPTDQTAADKILSDFLKARYLEHEEEQKKKTEQETQGHIRSAPQTPPPLAPQTTASVKDKKGDKGKKGSALEKPVPPMEPRVPSLAGSVAIGAVSLAVAKCAALAKDIPLYKHIRMLRNEHTLSDSHMPVPMVTVLSCGKASPGKLNLMEEIIVIPAAGQTIKQTISMVLDLQNEMKGILSIASQTGPLTTAVSDCGALLVPYDRLEQPLDLITQASSNLSLALGKDIHLALNCAADKIMDYAKGKYSVVTGAGKTPDELVDVYESLTVKYPAIAALIDPFRKEDVEQWESLHARIGSSCGLLAEMAFQSHPLSWRADKKLILPGVTGVVLKHSNETTITDLLHTTPQYRGTESILGLSRAETCDDCVVDLAVGLGVRFVKVGGVMGGERLAKWNRLVCVEEESAQQGIQGSRKLTLPLFTGKSDEQPNT